MGAVSRFTEAIEAARRGNPAREAPPTVPVHYDGPDVQLSVRVAEGLR